MKDNSDKMAHALSALAQDIIVLLLQEHQHIDRELGDVGTLISEASTALSENFNLLNAISDNLTRDTPADDQTMQYRDDIRKSQQSIITALQFDDIVQQLTKHSRRRTGHILDVLLKLDACITEIRDSDRDLENHFHAIEQLASDVERLGKELDRESPVKQSSLSTGKTELF